jgi:glyoxylase-like metal-dependent hydrolase (beta-lactamase superfamily II)
MTVHVLKTGLGLSFLIEQPGGLFLIDCGSPGEGHKVLRKMHELGRNDLKMIWITHAHYDHYGSAEEVRQATGAPVGVHPLDADFMLSGTSPLGHARGRGTALVVAQSLINRWKPLTPTKVDFLAGEGESLARWGLEATVLHTPGHTPGHTCILLMDGIAFSGDLISRRPVTRMQGILAVDWDLLPSSLKKLQAAHPKLVYTGHSTSPISAETLQRLKAGEVDRS